MKKAILYFLLFAMHHLHSQTSPSSPFLKIEHKPRMQYLPGYEYMYDQNTKVEVLGWVYDREQGKLVKMLPQSEDTLKVIKSGKDTMMISTQYYFTGSSVQPIADTLEPDSNVNYLYDQKVVARFMSVDRLTNKYPELTPYQFASNVPIAYIDIDGLEGGLPDEEARRSIEEENDPWSTSGAWRNGVVVRYERDANGDIITYENGREVSRSNNGSGPSPIDPRETTPGWSRPDNIPFVLPNDKKEEPHDNPTKDPTLFNPGTVKQTTSNTPPYYNPGVKLNVGGEGEEQGYTDVNPMNGLNIRTREQIIARNPTGAFVQGSITELSKLFGENSVGEILSYKLPQSLLGPEAEAIIREIKIVLQPGGTATLRCSDNQFFSLPSNVRQQYSDAGFTFPNPGTAVYTKPQ